LARFHASTAVGKTPLIAHCMIARELGGKIATRAVDFNLTVVRIRKRQRNKFREHCSGSIAENPRPAMRQKYPSKVGHDSRLQIS